MKVIRCGNINPLWMSSLSRELEVIMKELVGMKGKNVLCNMQKAVLSGSLWTDLHGTIIAACDKLTTGLQLVYDCRVRQRKCRSI